MKESMPVKDHDIDLIAEIGPSYRRHEHSLLHIFGVDRPAKSSSQHALASISLAWRCQTICALSKAPCRYRREAGQIVVGGTIAHTTIWLQLVASIRSLPGCRDFCFVGRGEIVRDDVICVGGIDDTCVRKTVAKNWNAFPYVFRKVFRART